MGKIIAVSGVKNSGKTTLIARLIPYLRAQGCRVAVIKHDGHDFEADVRGTDSYRHKEAGAYGTAVYSGRRFMVVKEQADTDVEELLGYFPEADLIMLEGLKYSAYPKIELVRSEVSEEPVCSPVHVLAYVTDYPKESRLPWMLNKRPCFNFDEVENLGGFLLERLNAGAAIDQFRTDREELL